MLLRESIFARTIGSRGPEGDKVQAKMVPLLEAGLEGDKVQEEMVPLLEAGLEEDRGPEEMVPLVEAGQEEDRGQEEIVQQVEGGQEGDRDQTDQGRIQLDQKKTLHHNQDQKRLRRESQRASNGALWMIQHQTVILYQRHHGLTSLIQILLKFVKPRRKMMLRPVFASDLGPEEK